MPAADSGRMGVAPSGPGEGRRPEWQHVGAPPTVTESPAVALEHEHVGQEMVREHAKQGRSIGRKVFADGRREDVVARIRDEVARGIAAFVARTGVDEVMVTSVAHDTAARVRSLEVLAKCAGLVTPA